MNIITFLFFLLWLAAGILVVRFVWRTSGTRFGKVAHWFGGAFVMLGLAIGMLWTYAQLDANFGTHLNVYLLTHPARPSASAPVIERHGQSNVVTVYRRGSVNPAATLDGDELRIDERQTTRTSVWWMLWDTKYPASSNSAT